MMQIEKRQLEWYRYKMIMHPEQKKNTRDRYEVEKR